MEDERRLYRLDGVAHVVGTINEEPTRCIYSIRRQQNMPLHDRIMHYLERAGLYHLTRLNAHWFWLDEPLVSAFIERWRPKTHTFHMPFGECNITLQDVAYQLGLPDLFGELLPPDKRKVYTIHFTWFHERFRVLPADASEETVHIYARAYIMILLSTQLFMDKSGNRVHLRWLPFVARLDDMGSYSWGAAALAWLYRCMCRVANRNVTNLAGPLQLLQSWIFWRFPTLRPWATYLPTSDGKEQRINQYRLALDRLGDRDPYGSLDVLAVIHPEILTGGAQPDGRGGDRWFPTYYRTWHQHWDERVRSVLSIQRVADLGPSAEYLDWWYRLAHRILLPGIAFADPRQTQVPDHAVLRGSSQVPIRVPASDMPDNRRVEWRRRIGTRATNREWCWLDDMMQEEQVGAPSVHHDDEAGSSRGHPTNTQVGGIAEASMGGTPFAHVSSSQVLHECSTQMLADLATTTFTMDLDDQLARPQFYADFAEIIRAHTTLSLALGGGGTPPSAFGVGLEEAPPGDRRATRIRRPTRCGTGSHLLGPFGGDHDVDGDQQ
ncbi:uncharacterized protein DS421_15g499360 [Arachis hypogaea]|nr:uncharacterized protein DS421_15g499360 [Arachis hypogaea]